MLTRAVVALLLVLLTGVYTRGAREGERPPGRANLAHLPMNVMEWRGHDTPGFSDDVLAQLGADDYVNRFYVSPAGPPVALYAGYYASQRQGDAIHSPQNCLPGAGWQPTYSDRAPLRALPQPVDVNRVVIQKGLERQAVFYWYQGRGRIVANEFANKGWLMVDAIRVRRTDGGLVRLITPVTSTQEDAFARLTAFSAALIPSLWDSLP